MLKMRSCWFAVLAASVMLPAGCGGDGSARGLGDAKVSPVASLPVPATAELVDSSSGDEQVVRYYLPAEFGSGAQARARVERWYRRRGVIGQDRDPRWRWCGEREYFGGIERIFSWRDDKETRILTLRIFRSTPSGVGSLRSSGTDARIAIVMTNVDEQSARTSDGVCTDPPTVGSSA